MDRDKLNSFVKIWFEAKVLMRVGEDVEVRIFNYSGMLEVSSKGKRRISKDGCLVSALFI